MKNYLKTKAGILCCSILFVTVCLASKIGYGQDTINLGRAYHNLSWSDFIEKAERDFNIRIFYLPQDIPDFKIQMKSVPRSLLLVLKDNLQVHGLKVNYLNGNYFVSRKPIHLEPLEESFFPIPTFKRNLSKDLSNGEEKKQNNIYLASNDDYVSQKVIIGSRRQGLNQTEAIISGFVTGSENNNPIEQATIRVVETDTYTTTDENGAFEISLPKGKFTISIKSMGMYEKQLIAEVLSSGSLDIRMDSKAFMLEGAVIRSGKYDNVRGSQMGFEKLSSKTINEIPVAFGEKDYLKASMLLPGVQSVGEVSSGFNVRGSPADQNMFMINGVPVYNVTHVFGFFSAFNADAIHEFDLYKSNIPIRYGGRLSSIFNITARKGNIDKYSVRGGISPVAGRLLVEGPIKKGKSSFLFSGRSSYSDWILRQINDENIQNSSAFFTDGMLNLSFSNDAGDELNLFAYGSLDDADLSIGTQSIYNNTGASLQWQHQFSAKLHSALNFAVSNYQFEEKNDEIISSAYKQDFGMLNLSANFDMSHELNDAHTLTYGLATSLTKIQKAHLMPLSNQSNVEPRYLEAEKGLENNAYIGETWKVNKRIEINTGLRLSLFSYLGPKTSYVYAPNSYRILENIIDTTRYNNNQGIANYHNLDYRLAAKYMIDDRTSFKMSYNKLHQYVFLLSNNIAVSPIDKWKLVDNHIKPMNGDQFSVGIYRNLYGNIIEVSLEAYYKNIKNMVQYKDGADFLFNNVPETDIIQGELDAWGIEFMIKKTFGDLTGWINYTYSQAEVLAIDKMTGEMNNLGKPYPANYDKPHAANLVLNYRLSKRVSLSSNLVYSTGRPITYPTSIFYQNDIQVTAFSLRNEYRLPDYFRVDLSLNIEGNLKRKKLAHGSWSFSVYNLTARKNAYTIYFRNEDGQIKGYKLSIFGTLIPSISYNFKLGNYED